MENPRGEIATLKYELAHVVKERSMENQNKKGDCLPNGFVSTLPERVRLDLRQNDFTDMVSIWRNWDQTRRAAFQEKYGDLALLLSVEVDFELIRAMVQFWDPSYRCFIFNEVDMVPTIEEYAVLLRRELENPDKIYWNKRKSGYRKKLASMTGLVVQDIDQHVRQKGKATYFSWSFLRNCFHDQLKEEQHMSLLALAIYGLVIFPKFLGHIEVAVVDFIEQLEYKVNVAPVILAETIRSLNYCRRIGDGRFIGCAQLLYIWMKSHLGGHKEKFREAYLNNIPIKEFCEKTWPESKCKKEWVSEWREIRSEHIIWRAPWMPRRSMLFSCGGHPWVPLLGIWGTIAYSPLMVRRQLGYEQFIPMTHGLDQREYAYTDEGSLKKIDEDVKAWKTTLRIEKGIFTEKVTPEYSVWHARRAKDVRLPSNEGHEIPTSMAPRDPMIDLEIAKRKLEEERKQLEYENKRLKCEMEEKLGRREQAYSRVHREKNALEDQVRDLKKQLSRSTNSHLREENERLKAEAQVKQLEYEELQKEAMLMQKQLHNAFAEAQGYWQDLKETTNEMNALRSENATLKNAHDSQLLLTIFEQADFAANRAREMEDRIKELRPGINSLTDHGESLHQLLTEIQGHYSLVKKLSWRP